MIIYDGWLLPSKTFTVTNNGNGRVDNYGVFLEEFAIKYANDTVIDGEENASDVDGVSVNAGYFVSGKTAIYYATFKLGESTVYIEHAGAKDESENVKNEIKSIAKTHRLC